ncbi:MAG: 2-oxoglutarate dehydrogenase complex dihydrolipoyllysine-residue succinyltransferase [Proteobacteria bacterium]|nr:2-oxoglutarate dehydrogenase complex dihydrolipoyllysine-residue succinyltransferase [Pseudomonadota bacterium]
MTVDVVVPAVGESIREGVLVAWKAAEGELVARDQPLFELETDKITMQIDSPAAGCLGIRTAAGAQVRVGEVVGVIDEAQQAAAPSPATQPDASPVESAPAEAPAPLPSPAATVLPPSLRRLARAHGLDRARLGQVAAEGRDARAEASRLITEATVGSQPACAPPAARETRRTLSSLRRRVAERLVQAQQQAAILTTFNEVDMSAVLALRARHQEDFVRRHGIKLGLMSFFVKAVVEALRRVPAFNARLDGDELVEQHYYDLGVAVGSERGLVVPVLRDVDRLGLAAIEGGIAALAERAATGRLELSELQGGCFTLSNGGVYGSLLSTPILNPPQCGILGMHTIKRRPVVVDQHDRIEARPMMYLALSYDHRIVDGREAVSFLRHVVDAVAAPERLLLEL